MDNEMNTMMAEGGLKTDGATTDPVSGNEVPTGSTAEEVRDDIPAKLSDGEYVVPADVVKFFGVSFFEKLRAKAKAGLAEMDADGRIGGEDTTEEEDDDEELPFSVDELQTEDDGMDAQMQDAGFAKGGAVTGNPTPADIEANRSTFNPAAYPIGFSVFGNQTAAPATTAPVTQTPVATTTKVYVNKQGQTVVISFDAQGNPTTPIPAGYKPQENASVGSRADNMESNKGASNGATPTTGGSIGAGGRIKLEDFASNESLIASGMKDIEQINASKRVGGVAGALLGGPVGSLVGSFAGTGYQVAELRAKIQLADKYGMTEAAETLRAAEAEALKDIKGAAILDYVASGTTLADTFYKKNPTLPTSTVTPSGTVGTSGGGTGVKTGGTGGTAGSTGGGNKAAGTAAPTMKATGTATAKLGATGTTKVGASKPVTGTAKVGGMTVTGTASTGNAKPAKTTSYGGGKAKGGLMQKKTKK